MTFSLDIPADVIAASRDAARDANISAARTFGFGGSLWDVDRPSGSGTHARSLSRQDGTLHALAFRQRPGTTGPVAGGTPTLADTWRMIILGGNVLPGDVVTSRADNRYVFGVASLEPWYEYIRAELERRR